MPKTKYGYGLFRGRLARRLAGLTEDQYQAVLDHDHLEKQLFKAASFYIDGVITREEAIGEWRYIEADLMRFDGIARSVAIGQAKDYPPELRPASSLSPEEREYRGEVVALRAAVEGRYHLPPEDVVQ
jgi:hypothetical protein